MKDIVIVIGTRPNFIKVTRFKGLAEKFGVNVRIIHTGQHYDKEMADVFFDQFGLRPDIFLNIKSGSQIEQIAQIMKGLEREFSSQSPDVVLVPGDVNSTFAAAFVAHRMGIKVGHIESGLRSRDMGMPEEVNRILTDKITDLFFVTEKSGIENLRSEGVNESKIHFVGNTMIDTLVRHESEIAASEVLDELEIHSPYALMTLHRPSNVDSLEALQKSLEVIKRVAEKLNLVLPLHPRTKKSLKKYDLLNTLEANSNIKLVGPLGYFDFQALVKDAKFVITDSGGIQEETTFRQVPCITLRNNTERPITVELGSNELMKMDPSLVEQAVDSILNGTWKSSEVPENWDGQSTERILDVIRNDLS